MATTFEPSLTSTESPVNSTEHLAAYVEEPGVCEPGGHGMVLPLGGEWELGLSVNVRVTMYFVGLIYSFIGVSIVADMFMAAIERITSKKRRVPVKGAKRYITTHVWNETVANLTLMALGSSAPEILLSINDILKNEQYEGALGPSTIVGSAAFNLFVIIAVCINALPAGETRRIKARGVFFVTAFFSLFAYVWLLWIVQFNTRGVISIAEGALTLVWFALLVVFSYFFDVGLHLRAYEGLKSLFEAEEDDKKQKEVVNVDESFVVFLARQLCRCTRFIGRKAFRCWLSCQPDDENQLDEGDFDPDQPVVDEAGKVIENEAGILTFESDMMFVNANHEPQEYNVKVIRKNGAEGRISCSYRMEKLTASPGFDYEEEDGKLMFRDGMTETEFTITVLPKAVGRKSDMFQIVLEEPENGAIFNPGDDGGEDECLLTVHILNQNPGIPNIFHRIIGRLDALVNVDEIWQGSGAWWDQIEEAFYCNGSLEEQECAGATDWLLHIIWFPWQMPYAILVPPPVFLGGWLCFWLSLLHIGLLTMVIGDMAELFGCCAGIKDSITAITFVALGTSVPDLFASKTAAVQDEWADASIVNVTGSNSVNVFLGIGLPWLWAAVYWKVHGADDKWKSRYPQFLDEYPQGAFIVSAGDLAFSVIVFTLGACVCLTVIVVRRYMGGELGGSNDSKAYSSCLLCVLWLAYIMLNVWKSESDSDTFEQQVAAIAMAVPTILVVIFLFSIMLNVLKLSRKYMDESGFWGIFIAVGVLIFRIIIFVWLGG